MSRFFLHTKPGNEENYTFESVFRVGEAQFRNDLSEEDINAQIDKDKNFFEHPVYVKLKTAEIDFCYYCENPDHPTTPRREIHLFSLPLENPEHTDYFLLNLPEYDLFTLPGQNYKLPYSDTLRNVFDNTAFLENLNGHQYTGIREMLLCFFYDLNNPGSHINQYASELAKHARERLAESPVYELIDKKFGFYAALHDYYENRFRKPYKSAVEMAFFDYLNAFKSDTLFKEIPANRTGKEHWFLDPVDELQLLSVLNKKHRINTQANKDIIDAFLRKHAILNAFETGLGQLFKPVIISMLLTSMFFSLMWLCWITNSFGGTIWLLILGVTSYIISLFMMFRAAEWNLLFPRLLIALLSGLFLLLGAQEFYTNLIYTRITEIISTGIIASIIIAFFLYAEIRQFSPTFRVFNYTKLSGYRIMPVLVYSFNTANVFVIVLQISILFKLVDTSNFFASNYFIRQRGNVENLINHFNEYTPKVHRTWDFANYWLTTNTKVSISAISQLNKDSIFNKLKATATTQNRESNQLFIATFSRDKSLLSLNRGENAVISAFVDSMVASDDRLMIKKMSDSVLSNNKNSNLTESKLRDSIILSIKNYLPGAEKIDSLKQYILAFKNETDDEENLKKLLTYPVKDTGNLTTEKYRILLGYFKFISDSSKNSTCIIYQPFIDEPRIPIISEKLEKTELYPKLHFMLVILSMFLGIVGQLIISDKTVTEGL